MKSRPLIVSGIAILAIWLRPLSALNSRAQEAHTTATPWQAARNVAPLPHHVPAIIVWRRDLFGAAFPAGTTAGNP